MQLLLSLYNNIAPKAQEIVSALQSENGKNDLFSAVQKSMDRNLVMKTYGARLGSLAENDRKSILSGSAIFSSLCVTCHGAGGKGINVEGSSEFAAPPLTNAAKRLSGDRDNLVKIILHGLTGPVDGKTYPSGMPSLSANNDEWVASVVNYVRYEFGKINGRRRTGDTKDPFVTPADVKVLRDSFVTRAKPWTLAELGN